MSIVLITGTSSGFGRAAAAAFVEAGHQVVATMRDTSKADGLDAAPGVVVQQLDVTDGSSRAAAVARTLEQFGRIDVLVNNAGQFGVGPILEMPEELIRSQFETNFFGAVGLIRDVVPSMIENRTGRIVNVTSLGAVGVLGFQGAYCATKHALDAVARSLDIELERFGIRVSTVAPGPYGTSIADNVRVSELPAGTRYPDLADWAEGFRTNLGRPTDLSPVTDAILAAAFDEPPRMRYLTGGAFDQLMGTLFAEGEQLHQIFRSRFHEQTAPPKGGKGS